MITLSRKRKKNFKTLSLCQRLRTTNIIIKPFCSQIHWTTFVSMKKHLFFLVLFLGSVTAILFTACEDTSKTVVVEQEDTAVIDSTAIIVSQDLKPELRLTKKASDSSKNWETYTSLEKILPTIKSTTLSNLKVQMGIAAALFEEKQQAEDENTAMPTAVKLPPAVKARVLVIETKVRILNDLIHKQSLDVPAIEIELTELHNSFQDLKLQMNERYAKSIEQMLEELRKEQEEQNPLDSNQIVPQDPQTLSVSKNE